MNVFHYIVPFVLALGLLVLVHELGHYLVARRCGVKVLKFSVGLGKPLLSWRAGPDRTEWAIAAIPFGGFVRMLDEAEGPVDESEKARAFNRQPVGKRFAIVAAGPLANFLLAILLYWGLHVVGTQELRARVAVQPAGVSAQAGLQDGDEVRRVAGSETRSWQELRWALVKHAMDGGSIELEVLRDGATLSRYLDLSGVELDEGKGDPLEQLGLKIFRPRVEPVAGEVEEGGAAARAGIQRGDRMLRVDGVAVDDWMAFVKEIQGHPDRSVTVELQRDGLTLSLPVRPQRVEKDGRVFGRVGLAVAQSALEASDGMFVEVRDGPVDAFGHALMRTWDTSLMTLRMLGRMLTGEVSWKNLSGPITIADYAGQSARMGLSYYVAFVALVSISLGVLNLLPVPVLDGGHLLYYTIEIIRGAPLPERLVAIGQQLGIALLVTLMVFAVFNDINRLLSS